MSDQSLFLLYTAPDGAVKVDVFFKDETVWLTQKALAELFAVKVPAINKHLKNIFESGELIESSVISILETTGADGRNSCSHISAPDFSANEIDTTIDTDHPPGAASQLERSRPRLV